MELSPLELPSDVAERVARQLVVAGATQRLVFLPTRLGQDGTAWYRDHEMTAPKELRSLGVDAGFLYGQDERTALSEYSDAVVIALALWVAQNLAWDTATLAAQYLVGLARHATSDDPELQVDVQIARVCHPDGSTLEGVRVRGPADESTTLKIIEALSGGTAGGGELTD